MTSNIHRRILEHNFGLVKFTKNRRPLELIHHESFENKSEASSIEKILISKKGKIDIQLLKEDENYRISLLNKLYGEGLQPRFYRGKSDRRLKFL